MRRWEISSIRQNSQFPAIQGLIYFPNNGRSGAYLQRNPAPLDIYIVIFHLKIRQVQRIRAKTKFPLCIILLEALIVL